MDDVGSRRWPRERILRREFYDLARGANHDLAFEWQLVPERSAQRRFAYIFAHNECADCADVNHAESRQLFGDRCRLAAIGFSNIDAAQKYNPTHFRSDRWLVTCDCGYLSSAFMGADMPPMISHVPCQRIHVCVIRNASVLASAPSPLSHIALIR